MEAPDRTPNERNEPQDDTFVAAMPNKSMVTSGRRSGQPIKVTTNHFPMYVAKQDEIHQYQVNFNPIVQATRLKIQIMDTIENQLGIYIFDGGMLYTKTDLRDQTFETQDKRGYKFEIEISHVGVIPPNSNNVAHLKSRQQLHNIVFKKILSKMKLKRVGRSHYDPSIKTEIPQHHVELWRGYLSAVTPNEFGNMICVDVSHRTLRTDTVLDRIRQIRDYKSKGYQKEVESELIGQVCLTRYNNRSYRIDGISWAHTPLSTFSKRDGEEESYQKYYSVAYNKSIKDLSQPLIMHRLKRNGKQEEILLIPELCCMTGLTDAMKSDFNVMRDLGKVTRVQPATRVGMLEEFIQKMNGEDVVKEELAKWDVSFGSRGCDVDARWFEPEVIGFKTGRVTLNPEKDWQHLFKGAQLCDAVPLESWVLLCDARDGNSIGALIGNLIKVGAAVGFHVNQPYIIKLKDSTPNGFAKELQQLSPQETQMVVCILGNSGKARYDAIKQVLCKTTPIPSQCVVARSLTKPATLLSICTKIALQINCKLGGELWRMNIPLKQTMLVGIDVCHDAGKTGTSVAGFCATTNEFHTKYYSRAIFQRAGQELLDGIKYCMEAALKKYFQLNGYPPRSILVFRDGVGDGQLDTVVKHEIDQFLTSFKELNPNYKPDFAMIVVKKRINTRIFYTAQNGKISNPPPGTIVDSGVTNPNWYDFFLVSQYVTQGTVTPTHYQVIYDSTSLTRDQMQLLTFKLCHLYYNWSGRIRAPAPCQYAHKLAFLVSASVHEQPDISLSDKLYYL